MTEQSKFFNWHDKYFRIILIIPAIILLASFIYLVNFYIQNGDVINRDISLSGGTSLTVNVETNIQELEQAMQQTLGDVSIREISDLRTGRQIAFVLETQSNPNETTTAVENYLGIELTQENSSVEFTGSSLGENFYNQLRTAILISFILMAIVVFIIFRTFTPSLAVIMSAVADITMTLALVNILGMKISAAGIVAFLMLIGYSVDTDILLTTRLIKRKEDELNNRLRDAFKTGITMTLTSIAAISIALLITASFSETLRQIFTVLLIGLGFDILNTWITNASILKWHCKTKNIN